MARIRAGKTFVDDRFAKAGGEVTDVLATRRVVQFEVDHDNLTAAATAQTVVLGQLQAGELVEAVYTDLEVDFEGGAVSALTLEIGRAGDTDSFVLAHTAFTDAANGLRRFGPTELGADLMAADGTVEVPLRPYVVTAAENLVARFVATDANVSVLTAGRVQIYVVLGPNLNSAYKKDVPN